MPNFPQYSPWQEATASVNNLGNIGQNIAVGLAQQRFQQEMARQQMMLKMQQAAQNAQLMQMHGKLYEAQTGLYNAQKTHYDTTTQELKDAADAAQRFGTAVATTAQYGMPKYADEGPIEHDIRMANLGNAPYEANRQAAVLSALGKHFVPLNMAQIAYQNTSPQAQAALAMGGMSKLYQNTPQGAVSVPLPGSGLPMTVGGYNLPQGYQRYAPQSSFDLSSILGGVMNPTSQTPVATNPARGFPPGHPAQAAAINAIAGHQLSLQRLGPDFFNAVQNIATNTAPFQATAPGITGRMMLTPKQKADMANKLARDNPTWSREQILQEVNKQ